MSQQPRGQLSLHSLILTNNPLVVSTHLAYSTTNLKADSVCQIRVGCEVMWSLAQQFACMRLIGSNPHQIKNGLAYFNDYAKVARCIAATYARFYLETEANGDKNQKGRYYWMALAAFASKTVACSMETYSTRLASNMPINSLAQVKTHLAKGNIWLFQDIAATHWYHNHYDCFDQCLSARGKTSYLLPVEHNLCTLPWGKEAVAVTDYFKITPMVKKAFALTREITIEHRISRRQKLQFNHLLLIAEHEQQLLQKLIYKNQQFKTALRIQRTVPHVGKLKIIFTSACSTWWPRYQSIAPFRIYLENYNERMEWIKSAAEDFHRLMINETEKIEEELATIASWHIPIGERRRT